MIYTNNVSVEFQGAPNPLCLILSRHAFRICTILNEISVEKVLFISCLSVCKFCLTVVCANYLITYYVITYKLLLRICCCKVYLMFAPSCSENNRENYDREIRNVYINNFRYK